MGKQWAADDAQFLKGRVETGSARNTQGAGAEGSGKNTVLYGKKAELASTFATVNVIRQRNADVFVKP